VPYRYLGRSVIAILIAGIAPLSAHHSSAPLNRNGDLIELGLTDAEQFEVYAEATGDRPQYLDNGHRT